MEVAKILGLSNVGLHVWVMWLSVTTGTIMPTLTLIALNGLVSGIKPLIRLPRPAGARGCDAFGIKGPANTFGMPSGHVATAVFGWMLIARHYGYDVNLAAVIAGLAMSWARTTVGCHTFAQGLMGGLLGWIWFNLYLVWF